MWHATPIGVAPRHELHRDVERAAGAAEVVDADDVRVLEADRDLRLVDEHVDEVVVLDEVREDALDGDQALEPLGAEGLRLEHLGHAAHPDALEEEVFSELHLVAHEPPPERAACGSAWSRPASFSFGSAPRPEQLRGCASAEREPGGRAPPQK